MLCKEICTKSIENVEMLPSTRLNHIRRMQIAENDLSESKMTNMDPVMELISQK